MSEFGELWFEELTQTGSHRTSPRIVTADDVDAFAALTGDFNPQHVDAGWAKQSFYGERIAHGALVLSCALGSLPITPERVLAIRRIADVVFKRATRLGDTLYTVATVQQLRDVAPEYGVVGLRLQTYNQEDRLVMRARLDVLWRKCEQVHAISREAVDRGLELPPGVFPL